MRAAVASDAYRAVAADEPNCMVGTKVIVAEQNARQALRISDYAYLLESGEVRGHGSAHEMREREDVRAAYLGG